MDSTGTQPALEVAPSASQEPQIAARTRWIDLGLVLLIAFASPIMVAVYALFHPSYFATPSSEPGLSTVAVLLRHGTAFAVLVYVLARQGRSIRCLGIGFRWTDPFRAVGLAVLAAMAVASLYFVVRGLSHAFGITPDLRHVAQAGWKEHSISELIHDVSSPIYEEVLVRGYLMTEVMELRKSAGLAILASVLLQTSYHVYYGLSSAVTLSGVFLVFALYYSRTRRLMPVLLAHLFWDLRIYFMH